MPYGQLFVISAPSGAGKTSLIAAALEEIAYLAVSISHTTRSPRPSEQDGRDYHFVSIPNSKGLLNLRLFLNMPKYLLIITGHLEKRLKLN